MIPKRAQANKEIIEIISEEWALSERDLELVKYTIKKALSLADTPRGTRKIELKIKDVKSDMDKCPYHIPKETFKWMNDCVIEVLEELKKGIDKR